MSDDGQRNPQWKQAADAVVALGGKATRNEVWEYLKRTQPNFSLSSVKADLNSVSVNAPARTSYYTGKPTRRTDEGNKYDGGFNSEVRHQRSAGVSQVP